MKPTFKQPGKSKMCGIFKHKTTINICLKVNALNLWNRSKPENEGRKLSFLEIANGEPAKADSVINGVSCLNITQNVSCLP